MTRNPRIRTINLLVENNPGVLNRVSGMIRRRGFNIEELSVGPCETAGQSRMTLTVDAGHGEGDQVRKQLGKLIEVLESRDLTDSPMAARELVLARVEAATEDRGPLLAELRERGGRVIESSPNEVIVELTADPDEAAVFIKKLRAYKLKELGRSGPVAMRGLRTTKPKKGEAANAEPATPLPWGDSI